MSRTLAIAHDAAWARRAQETAMGLSRAAPGRDKPRDWWVVAALNRAGHLTGAQYDAALRLSRLLEEASGAAVGAAERVDGASGGDPLIQTVDAALRAENAQRFVLAHTQFRRRRRLFVAAFEFPHRAMRDMRALPGDPKYQEIARGLYATLDLLRIHFDLIDRDLALWNAKALDEHPRIATANV